MPIEREPQSVSCCLSSLVGGMNASVPDNMIGENEAVLLENYMFEQGVLRTRCGYSEPLIDIGEPVDKIWYDQSTDGFLLFGKAPAKGTANAYYGYVKEAPKQIGKLTGEERPVCQRFGAKVTIGSGDKLQYYDYENNLTTVEGSFLCDNLWVRDSRLGTSKRGDDNFHYSSTGDCTSDEAWKEDTNVASQAQWYGIGELDGGDIITTLPLSGDLIVFKTNDLGYQISGTVPDLQSQQILSNTHAQDDRESFALLGNTIVFATDLGIRSLQTTTTYGNFDTTEVAYKINRLLQKECYKPRIWNMLTMKQLWIRPNAKDEKNFYIYQYDTGAAYKYTFHDDIHDVAQTDSGIMLATDKGVCRMNDEYTTDNGEPIHSKIISKMYITPNRIITRYFDIFVEGREGDESGKIHVQVADRGFDYSLTTKRRVKHFYNSLRAMQVIVTSTSPHRINNFCLYGIDE